MAERNAEGRSARVPSHMRSALLLASILVSASVLAGCTSDGNLGEIDEADQAARQEERASNHWERAGASHEGDLRVSARTLEIAGGLPPIELTSATLVVGELSADPFGQRPAAPPRVALAGAIVDGERGWLAFDATPAPVLAGEGAIALASVTVRAEGAQLAARTGASGFGLVARPAGPDPSALPAKPDALANHTVAHVRGVALPPALHLDATNATFYDAEGHARALAPGRIETHNATLVLLVDQAGPPTLDVTVDIPLAREDVPVQWSGNLTLRASAPSGTLRLPSGERFLAHHNEASFRMREGGRFTLTPGAEWSFETTGAEFVDVQAGAPRLEAKLRLAPEVVNATGPAGNTTRVKLILAETSLGADAHITGYRIDADVNARYVGWEPFAITNELLRVMNETDGPIEAGVLLTLGIAVPIVAFGEAFAAFFQTLFPPSLEGTLGPGEARILTFELETPTKPREIDILIEAKNAEPVRATLRLAPIG